METLSSCISFTHSWACFAECVTKISRDVNDGCPLGSLHFRTSLLSVSSGLDFILQADCLTTAIVRQDTFKKTLKG